MRQAVVAVCQAASVFVVVASKEVRAAATVGQRAAAGVRVWRSLASSGLGLVAVCW